MKKVLLLAALTLCASPVFAADRFAEMDKDKNGTVSWQEFEAAMPQMRKAAFDSIDANKDGAIAREEWDGFRSTHGAQGGMPGGAPAGMPGKMPAGMSGKMAPSGPEGKPGMPMIQPPAQAPAAPGILPPKQN